MFVEFKELKHVRKGGLKSGAARSEGKKDCTLPAFHVVNFF